MVNSNEILDRIKGKENFSKDHGGEAALARYLGIKHQTLDMWRKRGNFNTKIIIDKCKSYDLNWLFLGQSSPFSAGFVETLRATSLPQSPADPTTEPIEDFVAKAAQSFAEAIIKAIEKREQKKRKK